MSFINDLFDENKQNKLCIDLVTEFFDGKYTEQQVEQYLFEQVQNGETQIRNGVKKLADEFIDEFGMGQLANNKETDTKVRKWYESTDFYIFDLLPWNFCGAFQDKLKYTKSRLEQLGSKTIVDYGGGLGIVTIALAEMNKFDKIYYGDLKGSVTYGFAEFLIKKYKLEDKITMMGDEEYFKSDLFTDIVVSNDCFEHIVDLDYTLDNLVQKSNTLLHDSTFHTDENTPMHVQTQGLQEFCQSMLDRYFLVVNGDARVLNRMSLRYNKQGQLDIGYKR